MRHRRDIPHTVKVKRNLNKLVKRSLKSPSMSNEVVENGYRADIPLEKVSETLTELESPPITPTDCFSPDDPPVIEIERDLDALSFSGSTINDLEVQLTRTKEQYQRTLVDSKRNVEELRKKLNSHIKKSEPFIEIWRKARQVQEESNKAAMRFDKANSQHAASKQMIRMAEAQLAGRTAQDGDPGSPSPLDLAWQEMLNHATLKVVDTERERRASALEHETVLEKVRKVMEDYRSTEKRLRSHIIKSRAYYEERYRANQRLGQLKSQIGELERKINESKRTYTNTLKKLELISSDIHHRRALSQTISQGKGGIDPRLSSSTGSSPRLRHHHRDMSDTESLDSVQVPQGFTGSIGSLPSVGAISLGESVSPTPPLSQSPDEPATPHAVSDMSPERLLATQLVTSTLGEAVKLVEHNS